MTASVTVGRALRYADGSARGLLHHQKGHGPCGLAGDRRKVERPPGHARRYGRPRQSHGFLTTAAKAFAVPMAAVHVVGCVTVFVSTVTAPLIHPWRDPCAGSLGTGLGRLTRPDDAIRA